MLKKELPYNNKALINIEGERWKEIPFTDGNYVVSNYGRIKALERVVVTISAPNGRRIKEKILSQYNYQNKNKYKGDHTNELSVTYMYDKKRVTAMVRRLVYAAFIQPVTKENMDGKYVFPIDGNGFNCFQENLGLASKSELRIKDLQIGRYLPPSGIVPIGYLSEQAKKLNKLKRRIIKKYSIDGKLLDTYPSLTVTAQKNKVSISCVGLCAQKKLKQLKGFIYRYAEESFDRDLVD